MSDHARRVRRLEAVAAGPRCPACGSRLSCRQCGDAESREVGRRLHENFQQFVRDQETPSWLRAEAARLQAKADQIEREQLEDELGELTEGEP